MKAIETIRYALNFSNQGVQFLESMKDAPLFQPGPFGGNHAMWIAGHLAVVEGRLHKMLLGIANPVEHWKPLFDWGSEPQTNLSAYPPFEEVLQTLRQLRARTMAFLDEVGDAGLDQPTKSQPPGLESAFATVGNAILTIALHQVFHNGEATVSRRASGKQPVFVPTQALRDF